MMLLAGYGGMVSLAQITSAGVAAYNNGTFALDASIDSNAIFSNGGSGVVISGLAHERIRGNSIHDNGRLGIDLAYFYEPPGGVTLNDVAGHNGPNNFQNFPLLSVLNTVGYVTTIEGTLHSAPGQTYTFGIVKAAQARGDFEVLSARSRRALRVHLPSNITSALEALCALV